MHHNYVINKDMQIANTEGKLLIYKWWICEAIGLMVKNMAFGGKLSGLNSHVTC